jgi:O-antigen/teichoic acid export membrane protein
LSGASGGIIQYVDTLMIKGLIVDNALDELGVYSTMFFAAVLIAIPLKGINRISGVIVSEAWKDNDITTIKDVYKKSALNLLLVGAFLFSVGWACIDPVLTFLPDYAYAKYVFFFLGFAKLIELSTGVNTEIIGSSNKYKYNTYFNVILAVLAIVFNFLLISDYGILGAGIASFLAMTIVNVIRALFLYKTYKLWPFDFAFLKAVLIVSLFIGFASVLNFNINPILEIILKFILITVLYWGVVIKLNLSVDINNWISKMQLKFFKR